MTLVRRVLYVAWQAPATRRIFPVARLLDREQGVRWEFAYIYGARLAAGCGFEHFLGLEGLGTLHTSSDLPALFENRMMRASRPDFPEYITYLGLPLDTRDEIPILARSEGRRATDTIELYGMPALDETREVHRFMFFARGVRHVQGAEGRIAGLSVHDELALVPEPGNVADQLALQVHEGKGGHIGFVPSTLLEDFHELRTLGSDLRIFVEKVNPPPAPVHMRLLCRLEASRLHGYTPFSGSRYMPIPADATDLNKLYG